MVRRVVGVLIVIGSILSLFGVSKESVAHPFVQAIKYHDSVVLALSQKQRAKNVGAYYDRWKKDFLIHEKGMYRIASEKKNPSRTVSEGQGYGMLIVALMAGYDQDAKEIFDGLYRFCKAHPSEICPTFMTWQVPAKKGESDSAFDGDADIAYALLLASKQWGDAGKIDYQKEAKKRIDALMDHAIGKDSHLPLLGDWVEQDGKEYNQYTTRTSDFMLGHFRAFYRFSGDKRWLDVIHATQKALQDIQALSSNKTALVSDFIVYDHKKKHFVPTSRHFLEEEDDSYYYNACRVPWRVGVDALINGDKTSQQIVKKMAQWIKDASHENPEKIFPGYHLSGKPIATDYTSAVFIAPFGVSAKLLETPHFSMKIYESIHASHEDYFEDSVNLLCQLVMIDAFWDPTTVK